MCGFAGLFQSAPTTAEALAAAARRMAEPLAHRGPDDAGDWVDAAAGIGLAFRRLSILDLSSLGHQPMPSAGGRFTVVFNGEIYNHATLRMELAAAGASFRGHSDTEVLLAAFERWGIAGAAPRLEGMFAMAVWDAVARTVTLIRDSLGIKPLFVFARPGYVSFGSELKALVADPRFDRTLDASSAAAFLRYLYVPGPRTIYANAIKVPPGHLLTIHDPARPLPAPVSFWSLEHVARAGLADQFAGDEEEAVDELERLLARSVERQMVADVPLGALLSGGIDSSTVVALMQRASMRPVKTFSIAFDVAEHNEAQHAQRVASHLGTEHTEVLLTGSDALAVVPRLAEMFDEPHGDSAQIPAYLICGVARRDVTVALTGDGGDEMLGGYNRYTYGARLLERAPRVPHVARRLVAAGIRQLSPGSVARAHRAAAPMLPALLRQRLFSDKLQKFGHLLRADSPAMMYRSLVSAWQDPAALMGAGIERKEMLEVVLGQAEPRALLDRMMLADQLTYLVDDQLAKVDRVSMAVSLEVRVPLLDERLVEFTWRLPAHLKVRGERGKWLLRRVLHRYVPAPLVERPKMGFSVPLAQWLRGPLRPWAEELLATERLSAGGLLRPQPVRAAWCALNRGRDEAAPALWAVLMLQAWRDRWAA